MKKYKKKQYVNKFQFQLQINSRKQATSRKPHNSKGQIYKLVCAYVG